MDKKLIQDDCYVTGQKKNKIEKELKLQFPLDWQDKNFIKTFSKSIKSLSPDQKEIIQISYIEIFNSQSKFITDTQSQRHQLMCSYVLAAYKNLITKNDKQKMIEELAVSLKKFGGKYIQWSMKIMLWIKRDKQNFIETAAIEKSKESYGNSFIIQEERTQNQFTSVVKKCGYFDFFKRNGIPELTKVFCEWDSLWADEINKQKCGIEFKRPTTIADNNDNCRFEFHYDK